MTEVIRVFSIGSINPNNSKSNFAP